MQSAQPAKAEQVYLLIKDIGTDTMNEKETKMQCKSKKHNELARQ